MKPSDNEIEMLAAGFAIQHKNGLIRFARALLEKHASNASTAADARDAKDAARWRKAVSLWRIKSVEVFPGVRLWHTSSVTWDDLTRQVDAAIEGHNGIARPVERRE
ncbi:hypothetical protein ACLQ81_15290 [Bordetella avium]|uniref:hypothetical protein n=1 Tax=Bordetella avium TaxID=521 RepID=UPI000E157F4F|nr:hypothetical protein [Bordetella avium]RIQ11802.1 hypothetical protein D0432_15255 [Bordetella avium]RIQ16276.1 hypothetical protein D0850_15170 [Bordetella avium]SUW68968.1 Uncharacterised protein [Bordetella avium]